MTKSQEYEGVANRFLNALPPATLERLWPSLQRLNTKNRQIIAHIDGTIEYMYFVNRGLVSVVMTMQDGRTVEIGAVGIEGITNPNSLFIMDKAALESIVQIPGTVYRIRRDVLKHEMAEDAALHEMIQRYTRLAFSQLAQTVACNSLHSMEERCCRWLLVAHDSALSDTFPLTHEFLAMMLGVQRTGVSIVAGYLRKAGIIDYKRGRMTILDRSKLEGTACECHGVIQAEIKRVYRTQARCRSS